MKKELSNYFRRDFFEIASIVGFIKSKKEGKDFYISDFCASWDKKYKGTEFFREGIEKTIRIKLEDYLLSRVGILRFDLDNLKTMAREDIKTFYGYNEIIRYVINNESLGENLDEIEENLKKAGYTYSYKHRQKLDLKIKNIYESQRSHQLMREEVLDLKEDIEAIQNQILEELASRSKKFNRTYGNKPSNKIEKSKEISVKESIPKPKDEKVREVVENKEIDLANEAKVEIQEKEVDKPEDIQKTDKPKEIASEETPQKEKSPKEVETKSNKQVAESESENTRLKSIFDEFYNKVNELLPRESQPQDEDNFQRLKEEYDFIVKEKQALQEELDKLNNEIEDLNNRYIELKNTIKSREEEVDFKAVKSIYKILNDKDDLFLDKIYRAKAENKKLDQADFERIANNMISNLESFGIRVHPQSKNLGEAVVVKEADISEYRMSSKVVDEIQKNGSSKVKVKYPSWIYINRSYKEPIKILDSEMVE